MNHPPLEQFLRACGSPEPLRVGVGQRNQLPSESWAFRQPFLVIGRRPESDLMLDHWQVSRRHAYLQMIGSRFYCVDLGSRTGTHGGDASERSGWLDRNRAIQIGPFAVRPDWPEEPGVEARPAPGVTWELPGRAVGQAVWKMDRQLVLIGRSPACRIRIVEPDVSKFHCSLVLTPVGVWAVDLLGQKGVFVNDEPVRCARLEDGDELRVGRHSLRPRYDGPPPALAGAQGPAPAAGELATIAPRPGPFLTGELAARMAAGPGPSWPAALGPPDPGGGPAAAADPTVSTLIHQFGMLQQHMFDQFHHTMMMMFEGFAALHREQSGELRAEVERVRRLSQEIEELRVETARLAEAARSAAGRGPGANGHGAGGGPGGRIPIAADPARRATPPPPGTDIHAQLCLRLSSIEAERQNRWQKILGMMTSRP